MTLKDPPFYRPGNYSCVYALFHCLRKYILSYVYIQPRSSTLTVQTDAAFHPDHHHPLIYNSQIYLFIKCIKMQPFLSILLLLVKISCVFHVIIYLFLLSGENIMINKVVIKSRSFFTFSVLCPCTFPSKIFALYSGFQFHLI